MRFFVSSKLHAVEDRWEMVWIQRVKVEDRLQKDKQLKRAVEEIIYALKE